MQHNSSSAWILWLLLTTLNTLLKWAQHWSNTHYTATIIQFKYLLPIRSADGRCSNAPAAVHQTCRHWGKPFCQLLHPLSWEKHCEGCQREYFMADISVQYSCKIWDCNPRSMTRPPLSLPTLSLNHSIIIFVQCTLPDMAEQAAGWRFAGTLRLLGSLLDTWCFDYCWYNFTCLLRCPEHAIPRWEAVPDSFWVERNRCVLKNAPPKSTDNVSVTYVVVSQLIKGFEQTNSPSPSWSLGWALANGHFGIALTQTSAELLKSTWPYKDETGQETELVQRSTITLKHNHQSRRPTWRPQSPGASMTSLPSFPAE